MIRRQSGQFAPLMVACSPDSAPLCSIFAAGGSLVATGISLAPLGGASSGVFGFMRRITLDPGDYLIRYSWSESGNDRVRIESMRVLPGGDSEGAYRSITYYEPPHAGFIVGELTSNKTLFRRNPKV